MKMQKKNQIKTLYSENTFTNSDSLISADNISGLNMKLTVFIITCCSICLSVGQNISDRHCSLGEQCVHTGQCPDYLVKRKKLRSFSQEEEWDKHEDLLGQLKACICNYPQRKVCCSQNKEDDAQHQHTEECGRHQMSTGFVRVDNMQSRL